MNAEIDLVIFLKYFYVLLTVKTNASIQWYMSSIHN